MLSSPAYEIIYVYQLSATVLMMTGYVPYVQIFATFTLFMKTCLEVLQHRMREIYSTEKSHEAMFKEFIDCIIYYKKIKRLSFPNYNVHHDIDNSYVAV